MTVDQLVASRLGRETPRPSIVLACDHPATGYHETGLSMAYSSHLSWDGAGAPVPSEVSPARAFDSLFENRASRGRVSVLDRIKDRAATLGGKLSLRDNQKLDEYLTNVREVETRVKRTCGVAEDLREHSKLMCDILAIAFQTDRTRIASLMLARDLSNLSYPFLGVRAGHHEASHDDLSDGYERICRFHVGSFAYLAARLDAMPEGEGTVLGNSCLLFLSNLWAGWKHDNMKLPVVLAGGLQGTLETGRALDYLYAGDENRKLCSLYLSIMDRMGVHVDRFGDADTRLARL
jgi:hypothetical protein